MIFGKKKFCFAIALLSAIVFSLPVNASTLSIDNVFFGYSFSSHTDTLVTYNDGSSISNFRPDTGTFQVKYEGYDTWGFCVDLGTPLDLSKDPNIYEYTTQEPATYNPNLVYVEWLLDEYGQNAYSTTNGKKTFGAALQLAIWEVLYDLDLNVAGSYNLDSGTGDSYTGTDNFHYKWTAVESMDEFVNDFYDKYIQALTDAITGNTFNSSYVSSGNYVVAELYTYDDQGNKLDSQDIIINVVPEPTTALLLGFGLLGLCAVGRKRA